MREKYGDEKLSEVFLELWEKIDTGLLLVDDKGTILHANPAAQEMLEYTESELQSMSFGDITAYRDRTHDERMARETAAGIRKGYRIFKSYITKFDSTLKAKLQVIAITKKNGEFDFFLSHITPIEVEAKELLTHPVKTNWGQVIKDNKELIAIISAGVAGALALINK